MPSEPAATRPAVTRIAPWLSVANATQAIVYDKAAFGAEELERLEDEPGSVVVAHLSIGEATFWVRQDTVSCPPPWAAIRPSGWS